MPEVSVDEVVKVLSSPSVIDALQRPQLQAAVHDLFPNSYEVITIWILIATAIVATISALFIWMQLRSDHERSRRELAITLLREWTDKQEIETPTTMRLAIFLDDDQCKNIVERKPFSLEDSPENREILQSCLEYKFGPNLNLEDRINDGKIFVDVKYSVYIRFVLSGYLNLLESIMVAWYEGVAKPEIIEGQFLFLKSEEGADLRKLRNAFTTYNKSDPFPELRIL
jgi:hypothetical protein